MTKATTRDLHRILSGDRWSLVLAFLCIAAPWLSAQQPSPSGTSVPAAPPPMSLPPWATVKSSACVEDTLSDSNPANRRFVAATVLHAILDPATGVAIDVTLTATWIESTGMWMYRTTAAQDGSTSNSFSNFSLTAIDLSKVQGCGWELEGEIHFDALQQQAAGLVTLPSSCAFSATSTGLSIMLPGNCQKTLPDGSVLSISKLNLVADPVTKQLQLQLRATVTSRGAMFDGTLQWQNGKFAFTMITNIGNKGWVFPGFGAVTIRGMTLQYSGGSPLITGSAHAVPDAGTVGASIFGNSGFDVTLGGTLDAFTLTADFSAHPVALNLGGTSGLALTQATLTRQVTGGQEDVALGGTVKLDVEQKTLVHGDFTVEGTNLVLRDVDVSDVVHGATVTLTRSQGMPQGTTWSATFNGKVSTGSLQTLVTNLGLPTGGITSEFNVSGVLNGQALRLEFSELPSLSIPVPSWLPLHLDTIKEFAITLELGGQHRSVVDFKLDFDFGKIPGFSSLPEVSMSALWGKGVAAPPKHSGAAPAPNPGGGSGSAPWFGPHLSGLGGAQAPSLGWYDGGGASDNSPGFAFGAPDLSALKNIALGGPGSVSFSKTTGGMRGGQWVFGGGIDMAPATACSFKGFSLPRSLPLNFDYDGTTFKADLDTTLPDLNLVPDLGLGLGKYSLTRDSSSGAWTLSLDAGLKLMSYSKLDGKITMDGKSVTFASLPSAQVSFTLPDGCGINLQNFSLSLGGDLSGSGTVTLTFPQGNPLGSLLGTSTLTLSFSPNVNSWTIDAPPSLIQQLPQVSFFSGGSSDKLAFTGLSLGKVKGVLTLIGSASLSMMGFPPLPGKFTGSPGLFQLDLPNVALPGGLSGVTLSAKVAQSVGAPATYDIVVSGSIPRSDVLGLYKKCGITTDGMSSAGTVDLGGEISSSTVRVEVHNFPPPNLPGLDGLIEFKNIQSAVWTVDRGSKGHQTLCVTADMAISKVVDSLTVTLTIDTANASSPDIALTLAVPDPPVVNLPDDAGTLGFTSISGGRTGGFWSVGGSVTYTLPSRWQVHLGPVQLDNTPTTLGLSVNNYGFSAAALVPSSWPNLDLLPGAGVGSLKMHKLQLACAKGQSPQFSIPSELGTGSGKTLPGEIGFGGSIAFSVDLDSLGYPVTFPIKVGNGSKLADITLHQLGFGCTPSGVSLNGKFDILLTAARQQGSLMNQVFGTTPIKADVSGSPQGFFISSTLDLKPPSVKLGPLGDLQFELTSFKIGSDSTLDVTGQLTVSGRAFSLDMGEQDGNPIFKFVIEDGNPLAIPPNGIFNFDVTDEITLATVGSFEKVTLGGLHIVAGPDHNPLAELDATNLVCYVGEGVAFPFWDDMGGFVQILGFKAQVHTCLPDPLKNAGDGAQALSQLFGVLSGKSSSSADAVDLSFAVHDIEVDLSPELQTIFGANRTLKLADANGNTRFGVHLSTLLSAIRTVRPEDLGLALLKDITGRHPINLGFINGSSDITFSTSGFHCAFHLATNLSCARISGDFSGDISTSGTFNISDACTLQLLLDGAWETVSDAHVTISNSGVTFSGGIRGLCTVSGSIDSKGQFSFAGDLSTMIQGNGIEGSLHAGANTGFRLKLDAGLYLGGQKIHNDDFDISGSNITWNDSDSIKLNAPGKHGAHLATVTLGATVTFPLRPGAGASVDPYASLWEAADKKTHKVGARIRVNGAELQVDISLVVCTFDVSFNLATGKISEKVK